MKRKRFKNVLRKAMKALGGLLVVAAGAVGTLIGVTFVPFLSLALGYWIGAAIELLTNDFVTNSLNLILNTERFHDGDLPGILAVSFLVMSIYSTYRITVKAK